MSSGMNMQEAEKVAENMSYRQAVFNCLNARCVPYRKATKIKMKQLLEIVDKQKEHDAKVIDDFAQLLKYRVHHNIFDSRNSMIECIDNLAKELKEELNSNKDDK